MRRLLIGKEPVGASTPLPTTLTSKGTVVAIAVERAGVAALIAPSKA
jgi:hypothetical protein